MNAKECMRMNWGFAYRSKILRKMYIEYKHGNWIDASLFLAKFEIGTPNHEQWSSWYTNSRYHGMTRRLCCLSMSSRMSLKSLLVLVFRLCITIVYQASSNLMSSSAGEKHFLSIVGYSLLTSLLSNPGPTPVARCVLRFRLHRDSTGQLGLFRQLVNNKLDEEIELYRTQRNTKRNVLYCFLCAISLTLSFLAGRVISPFEPALWCGKTVDG